MIDVADQPLPHEDRVVAFREAIDQVALACNQLRVATHQLIDADLPGAVDVARHALYVVNTAQGDLERQFALFPAESAESGATEEGGHPRLPNEQHRSPLTVTRTHRGRAKGIEIVPGSVRKAREESGLSLAKVANHQVSAVAIHLIEKGRVRPSLETLKLIARSTHKPLKYFLSGGES